MSRSRISYDVRVAAADLARHRTHPVHKANGDEQRYAPANHALSFTKGLEHDKGTGLVADPAHYLAFRRAIDEGLITAFQDGTVPPAGVKGRQWEAPTAGVVTDLQGPDAQAVTMAPAPAMGSDELAYEMAEVYELALLRDEHLDTFEGGLTATSKLVASLNNLNKMQYTADGFPRRPRKSGGKHITPQQAFRGSSPGVVDGPYLSQFMLIGNGNVEDGRIGYGPQQIDQRVPVAAEKDWMTAWDDWLAVQNGANVRDNDTLFDAKAPRRFIKTPRDLATYVHDDALYQAYLNACLILLGMRAPLDPAFKQLSGAGSQSSGSAWQAGGFALFGGPHILTLVTEVATRGLKAVRFQKFNNHIRLRPETLAGRIEKAKTIDDIHFVGQEVFQAFAQKLQHTIKAVKKASGNALLPMAFQEGSPMHPAYGAGHATVAGACVTILKAFFDTGAILVDRKYETLSGKVIEEIAFRTPARKNAVVFEEVTPDGTVQERFSLKRDDKPVAFRPDADGANLVKDNKGGFLTLEGELNKLAANISIGRNMAGVHYFSDYYDSLRMGEEIAIGMLEEQALCYITDPFVMSIPTFDGDVVRIGGR
ncbi:bromoperoxidase [Roseibium denhamense]|uniref:Vanadium-dependent haloperoxidase n=1 Tax=Roseibium denhamense TaxID=76305 RepID=A0ABY1PLM4_9HYPH|nr:vanadium-dependent haloperoxidase [Roseibium denhamense]MTI05697.1 bromoperoxidase [Roseibium denhamense]SMP36901.1 hypothetical protein SAMN06265374_4364 [Roseibium denhamense]